MIRPDPLSLLTTSINDLCKYVRVDLLLPIFCIVEINPFLGVSTKIFQDHAQWVVPVTDWKDNTDYRGLLSEADAEITDIEKYFDESVFSDSVYHIRQEPEKFLVDKKYYSLADMIYFHTAPGESKMRRMLQAIQNYDKLNIIAGFGYDKDRHPGTVLAINSVIGVPDNVFPDTSWIKIKKR